jgi:hypothetical protein
VKGLCNAKYAQLQAVLEMARRHTFEELDRGDVLTSPEATRAYLSNQLRHYPHEVFACLFLDNQHHILKYEELFTGTIDGASVYPREVVKKALQHNAAAAERVRSQSPLIIPELDLLLIFREALCVKKWLIIQHHLAYLHHDLAVFL